MSKMYADSSRKEYHGATGIFVRAHSRADDKIGNYDLAELEKDSVVTFCRSRGEKSEWAEGIVLLLLGHSHD